MRGIRYMEQDAWFNNENGKNPNVFIESHMES